jgi:hypothetical protein
MHQCTLGAFVPLEFRGVRAAGKRVKQLWACPPARLCGQPRSPCSPARAGCAWLRALRAASQGFDPAALRGLLTAPGRRAPRNHQPASGGPNKRRQRWTTTLTWWGSQVRRPQPDRYVFSDVPKAPRVHWCI